MLSHNKTLAAQLYSEFRAFFPENAVEYFVSYYDYYQPEAYLPASDTYIEKDLAINDEIEKLRLRTTSSLLSATVLAESCALADAYGTMFISLGLERSLEVAEKEQIAALFIYDDGGKMRVHKSKAFEQRVKSN